MGPAESRTHGQASFTSPTFLFVAESFVLITLPTPQMSQFPSSPGSHHEDEIRISRYSVCRLRCFWLNRCYTVAVVVAAAVVVVV